MAEIPSFFNKQDFFGVLLPGYLAVTLYLLLFQPDLLFTPARTLSFDLFSAIVFIVAGPAIGLAISQFHRGLYYIIEWIEGKLGRGTSNPGFSENYAHVRLEANESEKLELDATEAEYDFAMSTSLVFVTLGVYHLLLKGASDFLVAVLLIVVGAVFVLGGISERNDSYSPMVNELMKKYPRT